MRVVLFTQGYSDYVLQLVNALSEKIEVILFLPNTKEDRKKLPFLSEKVKVETYRIYTLYNLANFYEMISVGKRIKNYEPDLVHIQSHGNFWFFINFIILRSYKIVNTIHDVTPHPGEKSIFKYKFMSRLGSYFCNKFIVHGSFLKNELIHKYNVNQDDVIEIMHGNYGIYKKYSQKESKPEKNTILFFGRLWKYKGLRYLLEAIPFIKQKIPDLKVILAVHGEPLENYSPYFYERDCFEIHDYKIPDKDVSSFFERSKIVVTPYIEASQSGIIALAYSFGRPVVSTAVGSLTEVVNSDKTGFLVKPKEVKPLALAVIRLLKNKKLYNHMSKECYNYAYNELSWDNIATKTIELYRSCDK